MNKTNLPNFNTVEEKTFAVEGMKCEDCERKVEEILRSRAGVLETKADRRDKTVTVRYDSKQVKVMDLHDALLGGGYKPARTSAEDANLPQPR
ncbi:MAG TPA: heavy-metal-associated domain-containing protein [Methylomirabilota bacterium]|nr:heavy-metal-associated domain-containing protein [Methylomirabilota bacterium]